MSLSEIFIVSNSASVINILLSDKMLKGEGSIDLKL